MWGLYERRESSVTPRNGWGGLMGMGVGLREREGRGKEGSERDQGRVKRRTEDLVGEKEKPWDKAQEKYLLRASWRRRSRDGRRGPEALRRTSSAKREMCTDEGIVCVMS